MALFFFDFQSKGVVYRDEFGDSFDTMEQAAAQAQALLFDVARDDPSGAGSTMACEVRDDQGRVRYRAELTFRGEHDAAPQPKQR